MFRGFVEPTLSTLLRLLLSPQATSLEVRILLFAPDPKLGSLETLQSLPQDDAKIR